MAGRPLTAGEQILLIDRKDRRYLVTPGGGRGVPLPRRDRAPRRDHRRRRGRPAAGQLRGLLPRDPPDADRLRAQDAARGPGHLPEGPRPAPDAGRHLPRGPRARVRRGLRCPVHDPAAGRGRDRRATSCARTSPPGPRPTSGLPRRRGLQPLPGGGPRLLRGHRRDRPRPHRARPARALAGRAPRRPRRCAPAGSSWPTPRRSSRSASSARTSTTPGSSRPRPSRSSSAPGTSKASPVRPDHRMVAHTGFLTHARAPG